MGGVPSTSLLKTALWRVSAVMAATVVVLASIAYGAVFRVQEQRQLTELQTLVSARAAREQDLFDAISTLQVRASQLFMHQYRSVPASVAAAQFDTLFPLQPDGTRRSHDSLFDGGLIDAATYAAGMAAFIADGATLTADDKRQLLAAFHTVRLMGHGQVHGVDNFYFFTPGNRLIIFAPQRSDRLMFYRRAAPANLDFSHEEFSQITSVGANPRAEFRCTGLQPILYDRSGQTWTTGCMTPVDLDGRRIGAWGVSLPLDQFIARIKRDALTGADHAIITAQGRLIMDSQLTRLGSAGIAHSVDLYRNRASPEFQLFQRISTLPPGAETVVEVPGVDAYFAVVRLRTPDWFFITRLNGPAIRQPALNLALLVLLVGTLLLGVVLVLVLMAVRRDVIAPIALLTGAVSRMRQTDYQYVPTRPWFTRGRPLNEIDLLDQAFVDMSHALQSTLATLEVRVLDRTASLEQARLDAESANRSKFAFIAALAHDIRAPVSSIQGLIDVVRRRNGQDELDQPIALMGQAASHLTQLMNDLLTLSLIETDRIRVSPAPVDLDALCRSLTGQFAVSAAGKQLALLYSGQAVAPGCVLVDGKLLTRAVSNLLVNAIRYTSHGSIRLALACTAAADGSARAVRIEVDDTGMGIGAADLDQLIAAAADRGPGPAGSEGGAGLGLAVTRGLAQLLGGSLTVSRNSAGGSCFTIALTLPVASAAAQTGDPVAA